MGGVGGFLHPKHFSTPRHRVFPPTLLVGWSGPLVAEIVPLHVLLQGLLRDGDAKLVIHEGQENTQRDGFVLPIFGVDEVLDMIKTSLS